MMLTQGAYEVESTSERIRAGLQGQGRGEEAWAPASPNTGADGGMPAHVRRVTVDPQGGSHHEGLSGNGETGDRT